MNNSITCVIIDDEQLSINILENYVSQSSTLNLIKTFTDPFEGLIFLLKNKVDLLITDICMSKLSGFEVFNQIQGITQTETIFITGYVEKFVEAVEMNAICFLQKPVSSERFSYAIKKAFHVISSKKGTDIMGDILTESERKALQRIDLLTLAQMQILRKIAEGMQSKEIADSIHISVKTVETHRTNIKQILGITGSHGLNVFASKIINLL